MSQIARAVNVNTASCHAILTELAERGYVARNPALKTYTLGPSLVSMGNAAMRSQLLIARAEAAAQVLSREHGIPVFLTRAIGNEVVGIFIVPGPEGPGTGLSPGHRLPLVPPIGAPFYAWSADTAIDEWIARRSDAVDKAMIDGWRTALRLVRERGYQVLLRSPASGYFPRMIAELASGQKLTNYKKRISDFFEAIDQSHRQIEMIEPDQLYEVILIAAPIFDQDGDAIYNLCIGISSDEISGEMIERYAEGLLRTCVQIMRDGRAT